MYNTDPDAQAFPGCEPFGGGRDGLSAREHAAIALRVPDSGNPWLDEMIRTAQRNDLAVRALAALIGHESKDGNNRGAQGVPILATFACEYADAMLAEQAKPCA